MAGKNPETERAIKEHSASGALHKLIISGCNESTLLSGLSLVRDSADAGDSWKDLIGQAWPGNRGDLKRKLESSIRQIRDCATEMKRLESTRLWALMLSVRSLHSPGSQFVPWSQALERSADTWSDAMSGIGPKKHPFALSAKAMLVSYVKETTGDWHDAELSALIEAVTGTACDAHTHLQWRHENENPICQCQTELRQRNHPNSD